MWFRCIYLELLNWIMEKIFAFTKSHWKKFVIASIPVSYGISYIKTQYQVSQYMGQICNAAHQYSIPRDSKVLVVLNPVANKKKCEKQFQKYCEPVLHMAGYAVEVVKTKHIGHAKTLMETLQQLPDIVVVAGGDGTSSEVVTGLIRRSEPICPILFLPLGEKNNTALKLMRLNNKSEIVKNLCQCMLALLQGRTECRPVIKYELVENDKPELRKPIFGICALSWGILKDIEMSTEKYWYFGAFKHYVSVIIASLSNKLNENILVNILSTPPCFGCNKCENAKNKSWLNISKLLHPNESHQPATQLKEHKPCLSEKYYTIDGKQIEITCGPISESFYALKTQIMEYITPRFDMMQENKIQPSIIFDSHTIEVIPIRSEHQSYYIDGESYDAKHIKISFIPNALTYFC